MAKRKSHPIKNPSVAPAEFTGTNPLDIASPLSETVQIKKVVLSESRVVGNSSPGDDNSIGYLKIRIHDTSQGILEGSKNFWVQIPFSLIVVKNPKDNHENNTVFSIEVSFVLTYQTTDPKTLNQSTLEAFAKTNGVYNAWPYWREYAQSMSLRMGFPAVTVPVFRL